MSLKKNKKPSLKKRKHRDGESTWLLVIDIFLEFGEYIIKGIFHLILHGIRLVLKLLNASN
ncbi:hypothetical protein [Peribacillus kribbensis]|uniref:hypothetical protein n=1 Tax=Peribacillus kribbensis TaxID=356658 RepID=UPI00040211A3|nr:hypothetical protein [Peribacillus kribbensis]